MRSREFVPMRSNKSRQQGSFAPGRQTAIGALLLRLGCAKSSVSSGILQHPGLAAVRGRRPEYIPIWGRLATDFCCRALTCGDRISCSPWSNTEGVGSSLADVMAESGVSEKERGLTGPFNLSTLR